MKEIIKEDVVREYIKRLPDLSVNPPSVHLLMLAVRARKVLELQGVKMKDMVLQRKIIRPLSEWRQRYFDAVWNFALIQFHGSHTYRDVTIGRDTMGLIATMSPRNVIQATSELMKENFSFIAQHDDSAMVELAKQETRFFSLLHQKRAKGAYFVTVDIDVDDESVFKEMKDLTSSYPKLMITQPSRGWHIVLDLSKEQIAQEWYTSGIIKAIREKHNGNVEILTDSQEPIPGTFYTWSKEPPTHYVELLE